MAKFAPCFEKVQKFLSKGFNQKAMNRMKRINILSFVLLLCSLILVGQLTSMAQSREDPVYQAGKATFMANCASCHHPHKDLTGPLLAGVSEKYDTEWLYAWIKNSQALIKAGDPQAVKIFNEWNGTVMSAQNLTNVQIDEVLAYLDVEKALGPPPAADGGGEDGPKGVPVTMTIFMGIMVIALLFILYALSRLTGTLNNLLREKMGKLIPKASPSGSGLFSKKMLAFISILALIFLGYRTIENAQRLGRQQGYAPEQPIKFSHALHAGQNQIDCKYCHSGALKGKSAVIPSANVCMNCHKAVAEGPQYGKTEIQKIYDAVGWDPDKKQYIEGYKEKPIEWIRIHNLPDHAYFNHAQHVKAGGVECQTCHGEIQEMEVVEQHSSLGMGWCINCHRETEVQFKTNEYYQIYEKYHEDLKNGKIKKVTVEDIGGTECQKCHY